MHPYGLSPLNFSELDNFFKEFDFSEDEAHTREYLGMVQESAYCQQIIIHEASSISDEDLFGFVALSITHEDVDNVPGLLVEFIYVKPKYRKKIAEFADTQYSYIILDYIIEVALKLQKQVAINHVYLVPVNEKVRALYLDYGFVNIPSSGKNENEDFMVFNLLDEDPVLM